MTKMFAGVTDVDEAEIAITGGADIIDVIGRKPGVHAAARTVRQVVSTVLGRCLTSTFVSGTKADPALAEDLAGTGVDCLRIGLAGPESAAVAGALAGPARQTQLLAVLYADLDPDFGLLDVLAKNGFAGVMLDTADKTKGRLLDHIAPGRIESFLSRANALNLRAGLAGSLEAPDVARLLPLGPDFLGFRDALCVGPERSIDLAKVKAIRALIPREEVQHAPQMPGQPGATAQQGFRPVGNDRIFVRDFVLPVELGAYRHERGRAQKVRFDVVAEVPRPRHTPETMRDVFSYDVILDGIRAIAARGHVDFAEALAEEVAAHVLADPRVAKVTVRVEKLELGAGGVGVEIERAK